MFKLSIWNIRGLNKGPKQLAVRNFISAAKLDLLCIVETKVKKDNRHVRTSLSSITSTLRTNQPTVSLLHFPSLIFSLLPSNQAFRLAPYNVLSLPYALISSEAVVANFTDEAHSADSTLEPLENPTQEIVEELLRKKNEDLQAAEEMGRDEELKVREGEMRKDERSQRQREEK
ncbi:hypothetical protein ACFX13_013465 [Malus domestica]